VPIDKGNAAAGQDGPPVRVVATGNTVYAAFLRWTGRSGADYRGDVVVVRDDHGGTQPADRFDGLGAAGVDVATNVVLPFSGETAPFPGTSLGAERIGSDLSIAVDPNNPSRVYVAYVDAPSGTPIVHLMASNDAGTAWSPLFSASSANGSALPSVAVAGNGVIGLLYTSLTAGRLQTNFLQWTAAGAPAGDSVLASFIDGDPSVTFDPYIGDFQQLTAAGDEFFGAFSASNDASDPLSFPSGVTFDRTMLDGKPAGAPVSIDPFYFSAAAAPEPTAITIALVALLGLFVRPCARTD
jgi:hypothetical protein